MGEADPTWAFTGADHAEATAQGVGEICKNHCPINKACVEDRCRFFRLEKEAERYLAEGGIE